MRSLDQAKVAWEELRQYRTLKDLKEAIRLDGDSSIATNGGRSACWKAFLLFEDLDTSSWIRTLSSTRSAYNSLKTHFLRHIENPDELSAGYDPLSGEAESSPWEQLRKDEELRGEILQDVVRCMPENLYFRQPDTQKTLTDILFIFCKLNPDVSYRQGMHELAAPILWVVEKDAIDLGHSSKAMGEDEVVKTIFDPEHVEHDTFALFGQVMQSAKSFYEQTTTDGKENPMVSRSKRIFSEMLSMVDERLAEHLERIEIVPQVFLIRWIRLLFGREFTFDEMLTLWDVIFAEDPSLEIVDHICVAMILRIRWDLIDADYNVALTLLLRYPEPGGQVPAQTLALDGLYLRDHLDRHSGSYLVAKYTARPLQQAGRPVTPPALQRNITTFSGQNAGRPASSNPSLSANYSPRATRNLEGVLQSTARNIFARGEKLGINKVVRNAVDEVQRKAQEIRDSQVPSTPPRRPGSRNSLSSTSLLNRVRELEERNRQLGKLLEGAVGELWEYQRTAAESSNSDDKHTSTTQLEELSVAIAKVQFIQVYLGDPALPLPQEDPLQEKESTVVHDDQRSPRGPSEDANSVSVNANTPQTMGTEAGIPRSSSPAAGAADSLTSHQSALSTSGGSLPPSTSHISQTNPNIVVAEESSEQSALPDKASGRNHYQEAPIISSGRPSLDQSSFSWMLGRHDGSPRKTVDSSSTLASDHAKARSSLFGGTSDNTESVARNVGRNGSNASRTRKWSTERTEEPLEDAGFDLETLRHSKGKAT